MNIKQYILIGMLLVGAFSIGRFSAPKNVETVYKEIVSTNQNQNQVEIVRETKRPDGTVIKSTRKQNQTTTQTQRVVDLKTTTEVRPNWRVGAAYQPQIIGFQKQVYSLIVERRILSELYLGVIGSSDRTVGITVSLGF